MTVRLRPVVESDLEAFYEQQADPESVAMARVPARDREAHFPHWQAALANQSTLVRTIEVLRSINDADTKVCVDAERALVAKLQGDCHSPIGAFATVETGFETDSDSSGPIAMAPRSIDS